MPARHISAPWDRLACPVSIISGGGVGLNGLAVVLRIRRRSDNKWLNPGVGWQAGVFGIVVPQPDAVNLPGYYEFLVPNNFLDEQDGKEGYILYFQENTQNILEYVYVTTRPTKETITKQVWTDDLETLNFIGTGPDTSGANLLWRTVTRLIGVWGGASPAITEYTAGAIGSGGKFYHAVGPAPGDATEFVGKLALYRATAGSAARLVRVTAVANDGNDHFVLGDMDGNAVTPTAVGDTLIVANANDFAIGELMDEAMSSTASLGSYKDLLKRMLGLRQSNMRLVQTAWNAAGAVTAGYILLYDSASDANTDTNPWPLSVGRYDFTAAYDGSLRLTEYVSTRTS